MSFSQEVTRTVSVESSGPFYEENSIIHCENVEIGQTGMVDGTEYTAVNESTLRNWADNWRNYDLTTACTSHVTDMSELFEGASNFNQDIGSWDVSNVTDMHDMFNYAESFNQNISSWDVSSVTYMDGMFHEVDKFNHDIGSWDVSSVGDMNLMFANAKNFNQNLSVWCVSQVYNHTDFADGATSWTKDKPD